jgi:hypothetical protein
MAKSDWTITGNGGLSIIEDGGSKRCRLSYTKLMLWNGNDSLGDCEIISDVQVGSNGNSSGGIVLRSNSTATTCYKFLIVGTRTYYIQKVVNGTTTTLGTAVSDRPWNEYTKTRFRIDGWQLSIEEYINGEWQLVSMVEDTSHAVISGSAGLFGSSINSGCYITFDNLEINIKS